MRRTLDGLLLAVVMLVAWQGVLLAQPVSTGAGNSPVATGSPVPVGSSADAASVAGDSIADIIFSGGIAGVLIIGLLLVLSMAGMALGVEHAITIRRSVLMPPGLEEELLAVLKQGQVGAAIQKCEANPSPLASLVKAALAETDGGWVAVEKGMEEEAAEQAGRLFRKIEYLSVLGNIAPMVGLLGTVIGMILAFREVANTQGAARAGQLASGIYQALVTTVGGLLVAIPSLGAYAVFRNRVDGLMAETVASTRHILTPVKRALLARQLPARPAGNIVAGNVPPKQGGSP